MNRKNVLWILLDSVFLIVFNVVFFVLGGIQHEVSVWISYGFIHFAYIMLLITPFLIKKNTNIAILGVSLYSVSTGYFFAAFIAGVIFILIHPTSFKASLVVQVIMAGIYAILLISNMIANEHTADSVKRHEEELKYVKSCSAQLKGIMDSVSDRKLKKQVEALYDLIHSSPVKSNDTVRDYELNVIKLIGILQENIDQKEIDSTKITITEIRQNAEERNRKLKYRN